MSILLHFIALIFIALFIFPGRKFFQRNTHLNQEDGRQLISSSSLMLQKCGSSRGDKADYYFDSQNRYEVIANITATIPLASIIEVKRETTRIGKRSIWSVDWLKEGQQKQARFLHNDTLFNQSFATFLDVVKQVNPDARVTSLTLFTL